MLEIDDITLLILDIFYYRGDFKSILTCLRINKYWNGLIKSRTNKYLKTTGMLTFQLRDDNNFRRQFKTKMRDIILGFNFHRILNKKLELNIDIEHAFIVYIPNFINRYHISEAIESTISLSILHFIQNYIYIEKHDLITILLDIGDINRELRSACDSSCAEIPQNSIVLQHIARCQNKTEITILLNIFVNIYSWISQIQI